MKCDICGAPIDNNYIVCRYCKTPYTKHLVAERASALIQRTKSSQLTALVKATCLANHDVELAKIAESVQCGRLSIADATRQIANLLH